MGTSGGNRLRWLREKAAKTQLAVELEAELGTGYLQRVEAGKVIRPERETLERILAALHASYTERQEALELFGYVVTTPLPEAEEIEWAVKLCQNDLRSLAFPAYLLDCAHRLLAYNAYFPRMIGSRALARQLVGESMFAAWFDPAWGLTGLLEKPEEFYPMMIRAFKYEGRNFAGEEWFSSLVKTLLRKLTAVEEYWIKVEEKPGYAVAARPAILLGLRTPSCELLRFRLTAETFVQDLRFRLIYFLPGDAVTIQQCATWAQENLSGPV
jgi:transcriptional regulator with XRE-family HTH domain